MVEQVTGSKGVQYSYRLAGTKSVKLPALQGLITPKELRKALKKTKAKKSKSAAASKPMPPEPAD